MINRVILMGRLTKQADLRSTPTGKSVVNFTLAVPNGRENADFINCSAWGKTAEVISSYTTKGSQIVAEGRLQTSSYDNPNGTKTFVTKVLVESVAFCDSKQKEEKEEPQKTEKFDFDPFLTMAGEELPF